MSEKTYVSVRKLNSLPVGSRIKFGDKWSDTWEKLDKGWRLIGSSFPIPWSPLTMLAQNGNRPYRVVREGPGA